MNHSILRPCASSAAARFAACARETCRSGSTRLFFGAAVPSADVAERDVVSEEPKQSAAAGCCSRCGGLPGRFLAEPAADSVAEAFRPPAQHSGRR